MTALLHPIILAPFLPKLYRLAMALGAMASN